MDLTTLADKIASLYDGPHNTETTDGAARAVSELIRYLNNATTSVTANTTLPQAPHVYRVLGGLAQAIGGLDQLFGQLKEATIRHIGDTALYDDRRERSARATAHELTVALDQSRLAAGKLASHLNQAWSAASHLGHDTD